MFKIGTSIERPKLIDSAPAAMKPVTNNLSKSGTKDREYLNKKQEYEVTLRIEAEDAGEEVWGEIGELRAEKIRSLDSQR